VVPLLRAALAEVESEPAAGGRQTHDDIVTESVASVRFITTLLEPSRVACCLRSRCLRRAGVLGVARTTEIACGWRSVRAMAASCGSSSRRGCGGARGRGAGLAGRSCCRA